LSLPVLDIGFSGSGGGQYHTCFDDFAVMDRFIDPGWIGHELAARFFAALLERMADSANGFFDPVEAARALSAHARAAGEEPSDWLGRERAERLAQAFEKLADAYSAQPTRLSQGAFYQRIAVAGGLPDRPWFKTRAWAPGLETGYSSETFPTLRRAALRGEEALDTELFAWIHSLEAAARAAASE
jgi:N-acetylated-alpha-linked acidic dipeptidase